jgi:hypothetical protein
LGAFTTYSNIAVDSGTFSAVARWADASELAVSTWRAGQSIGALTARLAVTVADELIPDIAPRDVVFGLFDTSGRVGWIRSAVFCAGSGPVPDVVRAVDLFPGVDPLGTVGVRRIAPRRAWMRMDAFQAVADDLNGTLNPATVVGLAMFFDVVWPTGLAVVDDLALEEETP